MLNTIQFKPKREIWLADSCARTLLLLDFKTLAKHKSSSVGSRGVLKPQPHFPDRARCARSRSSFAQSVVVRSSTNRILVPEIGASLPRFPSPGTRPNGSTSTSSNITVQIGLDWNLRCTLKPKYWILYPRSRESQQFPQGWALITGIHILPVQRKDGLF
ncbi:uncharacterized protein EI90DRAFT_211587 [Cantharellus anzutake]|uniref:uncharacterized protein n=1 Tax=Cantharellus anzutake TaxID=1750568 RepID=UPI0019066C65|nr:uncharacterized protein EI90DRAFT_211587 [Cantharellus anzutake]KAF8316974.1 hypothetical protein EI90DRAFT_211587 [Cantharellus anzutake]